MARSFRFLPETLYNLETARLRQAHQARIGAHEAPYGFLINNLIIYQPQT